MLVVCECGIVEYVYDMQVWFEEVLYVGKVCVVVGFDYCVVECEVEFVELGEIFGFGCFVYLCDEFGEFFVVGGVECVVGELVCQFFQFDVGDFGLCCFFGGVVCDEVVLVLYV